MHRPEAASTVEPPGATQSRDSSWRSAHHQPEQEYVKLRRRVAGPRHGTTTRFSPVGLITVLIAYGLLLGSSPAGQAGFLWLHLATANHDQAAPVEERHRGHDPVPAHRSEVHEHHEHHEDHGHDPHENVAPARDHHTKRIARPAATHEPHAHGGAVHTHEGGPVEDPVLLDGALSKFYLAPSVIPAPPPGRTGSRMPAAAPQPAQLAARIDTPPPRLPG